MCVAVVRYSLLEKPRTGVCTTYLQDRFTVGESCPVFISQNPDFRLPKNGDLPVIMIGPGTGIAPFRAFIQERGVVFSHNLIPFSSKFNFFSFIHAHNNNTSVLTKASGTNRLYFGCRHKDKDFLYKSELGEWCIFCLQGDKESPHSQLYVQRSGHLMELYSCVQLSLETSPKRSMCSTLLQKIHRCYGSL